ncbi:MAG: zinc-ribbon domain-containing protein [Clostridiales bacterium]|nr:zinc-ribbon domain-containing protein [Clostridiales bacterium]
MRNRFQGFMDGRYGNDQLNQCLSIVTLVLIVVNLFVKNQILWMIALILLIWMYFRMFSRNIGKRDAENDRFLEITSRFRRGGGYRGQSGQHSYSRPTAEERRRQREQNKYYRFFLCPHCNQKVRVPKGKGRIEITCPKCRTTFIKKT